ncbi:MAG: MFS transporter, partial [Pseudomonadota bacterium]
MTESSIPSNRINTLAVLSGPSLSIVLAALGISTAAVTLPEVSDGFLGQSLDPTLVVSIYVLAITALIVPMGRAGDLYGKRAVLVSGLCLYVFGAFVASEAPTLPILIASRFLQGAGAAGMMAMPLALVRDFVPTEQTGRWMGAMGMMSAIGTASGPALGGVVVANFGWRAVYLLLIPMALAALVLCLLCFPTSKRPDRQQGIDLPGASALAISLAALTWLLSDMANGFDASIIVLAAVAGGSLVAFLLIEANTAAPIIPLSLLRSSQLLVSFAMNAIGSFVMMGMLVVGPFFLMDGLGLTTVQMGLAMSVGPISSALSGIPAGRFTEKTGAARALTAGASAMAVSCAAMAVLPYFFGLGGFVLAFVLLAPSYQVFLAALNTSVMENASEQDRGVTSGILNLSRNFGFILGAGAVSAVFWSI